MGTTLSSGAHFKMSAALATSAEAKPAENPMVRALQEEQDALRRRVRTTGRGVAELCARAAPLLPNQLIKFLQKNFPDIPPIYRHKLLRHCLKQVRGLRSKKIFLKIVLFTYQN